MPPRYAYWTILAGGLPTAFRAAEQDELLPTFKRIQAKHPDAEMKYFARGKLWASPEDARRAGEAARERRQGAPRRADWRPGGEHRDPRQTFKDAKKKRNLDWRKERFGRRHGAAGESPREKPHGDPLRRPAGRPPGRDRFTRDEWPGGERPDGAAPQDRRRRGPQRDDRFRGSFSDRKPSGPPRDRKPGGPLRDRRRRG